MMGDRERASVREETREEESAWGSTTWRKHACKGAEAQEGQKHMGEESARVGKPMRER